MVQLYRVKPTEPVSPPPSRFVHRWAEDTITQPLWLKCRSIPLHAISLCRWKKHGLLAFYKMNKKKNCPNNSPEIKSPKVPENVNSKKCGGCKNHKLSFTFIYSIYVCSEQCSMVRAGNPVSAASHCGHASHSRGWAGTTPSHGCPFLWMSLQSLCLLWAAPGRSFAAFLQSPFQQDGSGSGSNSRGYLSRQWVKRYQARSLDMVLHFPLQKFVGSCGSHCLAPDLVQHWGWLISLSPEHAGFIQHKERDNN